MNACDNGSGRRQARALAALAAAAVLAAARVSFAGECLSDYRQHQVGGAHGLSEEQLASVEDLADAGDPAAGWALLGGWGDPYAALAARVLTAAPNGAQSLPRRIVTAHWLQAVGWARFSGDFQAVAVQHLRQYVEVLRDGNVPDSDQILLSYLTAVRDHGLPDITVFDAAWAASGYGALASWQSLNDIGPERTVPESRVCFQISPEEARRVINGDFLGARSGPD